MIQLKKKIESIKINMTKNQITKEEIEKLMKIPGEIRGDALMVLLNTIKEKEGEKEAELFKKKMGELGFSFDKIDYLKWCPVGFLAISLLIMKEIFNWDEKDFFELGNLSFKMGFIPRILSKYFASVSRILKEAPKIWAKFHTSGKLELYQLNEKKKFTILRLKEYKIHPLVCNVNRGAFLRIAQYVIKSKKITIEETKCMFKGDPYHEFLIRWE
ncbi:MAG: hypothetical protein QME57_00075 [Patescibacteria group bacterium]|nr:hypothetical protein [Patescibacteria group bacterium]